MWFIYIYLFILGLILGSFLNVVGLRVPKKQSIVTPRSACPTCGHTLTALELIPVFSYLFQKGKCKNCSSKISPIYPIMELLTGLLFVLAFHRIGFHLELIVALTLIMLLHIIVVSDLAYMIIPNTVLLIFLCIFIIERIMIPLEPWYDAILGGVVGFGVLLFIGIISKGGMGGGDIKLFGVLGIVLGLKLTLVAFFMSALMGAIIGGIGIMTKRVERKTPIPFGPFIAAGTIFAYFFGAQMLEWYFSLLQ